jgi:hypothetical protein
MQLVQTSKEYNKVKIKATYLIWVAFVLFGNLAFGQVDTGIVYKPMVKENTVYKSSKDVSSSFYNSSKFIKDFNQTKDLQFKKDKGYSIKYTLNTGQIDSEGKLQIQIFYTSTLSSVKHNFGNIYKKVGDDNIPGIDLLQEFNIVGKLDQDYKFLFDSIIGLSDSTIVEMMIPEIKLSLAHLIKKNYSIKKLFIGDDFIISDTIWDNAANKQKITTKYTLNSIKNGVANLEKSQYKYIFDVDINKLNKPLKIHLASI